MEEKHQKCPFLLFAVLGLILCLSPAQGLYEDEAGQKDWYLKNVGKVNWASFLLTPQKKRLLVATTENVIASLHLTSGDLEWRRVLSISGPIQFVENLITGILTVSERRISLWNPNNGGLRWESLLTSSLNMTHTDAVAVSVSDNDDDNGNNFIIVVLSHNTVTAYDANDGTRLWTLNPSQGVDWKRIYVRSTSSSQFFVVGLRTATKTPIVVELVSNKDREKMTSTVHELKEIPPVMNEVAFCGDFVVFLDTKGENIFVNRLGHITTTPFSLPNFGVASGTHLQLKDIRSRYAFVIIDKNTRSETLLKLQLKNVSQNATLSRLYSSQSNEFLSTASFVESRGEFVVVARRSQNLFRVVHIESNQSRDAHVDIVQSNVPVETIFARAILKKEGSTPSDVSIRLALVGEDASLHYVEFMDLTAQPKVKWSREEALSGIMQSEFLDLPANPTNLYILRTEFEDSDRSTLGIVGAFLSRVRGQLHQLKSFISLLFERIASYITHKIMGTSAERNFEGTILSDRENELLYKDDFGFRKLILILTKYGKVFALHSERGKILWSKFFPKSTLKQLFVTKKSIHYPPECVLLLVNETARNWILTVFNPLNGEMISTRALSFVPLQVILLPYHDKENRNILLFVDTNFEVHFYPDSKDVVDVVDANKDSIFLYTVNTKKGVVSGFALRQTNKNVTTIPLVAVSTWQKFIGHGGEVAFSGGNINIYQAAHITGNEKFDRYFYLNPNLVAIVTNGTLSDETKKNDQSEVSLYILDVVTGHILYHSYDKYASGPLHIVQCNNWVVYQYWNTKYNRFEMSVVELFVGKHLPDGKQFSSFHSSGPHSILSQTFINPYSITTLATTVTARGITNKWLLLGLSSGHIYGLDKRILDPRRPLPNAFTQEEREKGIHPYHPFIPYTPKLFVNYNRTVSNLRRIQTWPTVLESTSLVFAYGLDVFYTPVAPSKSYDRLASDFNFGVLFGVILLLFLVTFVVMRLAKRHELIRQWT